MLDWMLTISTHHNDVSGRVRHKPAYYFESATACEAGAIEKVEDLANGRLPPPIVDGVIWKMEPYAVDASCWKVENNDTGGAQFHIGASHELGWRPYRGKYGQGGYIRDLLWVDENSRRDFSQSQALCLNGYNWEPCS